MQQHVEDKYLLEKGDFLFARSGATVGKTYLHTTKNDPAIYAGYLIRFRPNKNILNPSFLFYFTKTIPYYSWILTKKKIVAQPNINAKQYSKELNIPIPPLEIQKKIISILEKAEQLKEHRKEADKLIDEYLKSKFLEMFGDPIKNDKKFEYDLLTNLCEFKSGGTPTRKNKEYFKGDIPWVRSVALGGKYIDSKNAIEFITLGAIKNSATKIIPKNSIMIGVRVGVGKTSINKCDMCTSQDIMSLVNIDKRLQNEFLLNVFEKYIKHFESQMRGATIKGITTAILKNLKIAIPPIELQNKFANIVEKVEKMKEYQKNSKQQIDDLYNNLMQKAFRGELVC